MAVDGTTNSECFGNISEVTLSGFFFIQDRFSDLILTPIVFLALMQMNNVSTSYLVRSA